ncbi:hypothetical protein OE88DRAFT_1667668 [Heliocybe sulcata]|uniref:Uncharacterized protein n=1 Tax=Heliocybe sulcata TaxID=5364 RepID=A0A5C3MXZ3_9AGAM|nr:hypothetical protein OE88DRAFT_1667668 [Heliocybe sulcata]
MEPLTQPCSLCGIICGVSLCSPCKALTGFSSEHLDWLDRQKHWHAPLPSVVQVTGILFPANEDAPRLVTVQCTVEHQNEVSDDDGAQVYRPGLQSFLGNGSYDGRLIDTFGMSGETIQKPLRLFTQVNDDLPLNQCVQKLMEGQAAHDWRGNLLVMKAPDINSAKYVDTSMDDLPCIKAFFEWYPVRFYSITISATGWSM